jgi:hypothetical protein
MRHLSRAFSYLLIALCLGTTHRALAATNTVTTTADTGAGSLRQAVASVTAGDTINFTVTGTITLTSGEIALDKDLTVSGPGANVLAVSGNNASRVFNVVSNATVSVSGLSLKNGTDATGAGGGIHNAGTLTLSACTISNCHAGAGTPLSGGGAIFNATSGVLVVVNSTLDNNQATGGAGDDSGGGIYNAGGSTTISNSTIAANTAQGTNGFGGGVFNLSGSVVLISSAIALNSAAGAGGGVANTNGVFSVADSIIATNAATSATTNAPDAIGDFVSNGFNLIGDGDDSTGFAGGVNNDQVGSAGLLLDPLLGPLQNNGGPTFTLALLPGSPAINAGSCMTTNGTDTDQRGDPRPVGPACDIGPFEVQACTDLGSTITCITTNIIGSTVDPNGGRAFFDTPTFSSTCPGATVQTDTPSGGLFPIGTDTVVATLLDASGTELTNCTFTVIIRGTDQVLDDAIAAVGSANMDKKDTKSILASLNGAKKMLLKGRTGRTCRILEKTTTRIDRQIRRGFITPSQANQFFPSIAAVKATLSCK